MKPTFYLKKTTLFSGEATVAKATCNRVLAGIMPNPSDAKTRWSSNLSYLRCEHEKRKLKYYPYCVTFVSGKHFLFTPYAPCWSWHSNYIEPALIVDSCVLSSMRSVHCDPYASCWPNWFSSVHILSLELFVTKNCLCSINCPPIVASECDVRLTITIAHTNNQIAWTTTAIVSLHHSYHHLI